MGLGSSGCSSRLPGGPRGSPAAVQTPSRGDTHQEEHARLEPLAGELAEAAQANELLRTKRTPGLAGRTRTRVPAGFPAATCQGPRPGASWRDRRVCRMLC